jgi:UDP-N-acetylmuramate--alanine ligase
VVSGAVEESVPDVAAARAAATPIQHRSELLAEILNAAAGVAVAGTSGKSTVAAMAAWALRDGGVSPSFLGGAPVLPTPGREDGAAPGPAAWAGGSEVVVGEADESDGSLVRYRPEIGVVTNLSPDHRPMTELREMFVQFSAAVRGALLVNADRPETGILRPPPRVPRFAFGLSPTAQVRGESLELEEDGSRFRVGGVAFRLGLPGRFNVENALAALAVARQFDVPDRIAAESLACFPGLARRLERVGTAAGVEVIDDFAHNPDKVAAALAALRLRRGRLRLLFQLHGFGPARMHRAGLVRAFAAGLGPDDRIYVPPIYFAGGTVVRDISAADYVEDLQAAGVDAVPVDRDHKLPARIAADCTPGDRAVVMGARDPSLADLARDILSALQ